MERDRTLRDVEAAIWAISEGREAQLDKDSPFKPVLDAALLRIRQLEEQVASLEQAAAERASLGSDLQAIRSEHHMAEKIQRAMLPECFDEIKAAYPVDVFADMDPAWEIGGDFYDLYPLGENRLCFCIADVSGKSVSAAMFSMVVKTALKMALLGNMPIAEACASVSSQLYMCQQGVGHMFATLWLGVLDTTSGRLEYVNAGHEPPVLLKADGTAIFCREIGGLPLAAYYNAKHPEKCAYTARELCLGHGDSLLLYTDGLNEVANRGGKRLSHEKIIMMTEQAEAQNGSMMDWIAYLQRGAIGFADHAVRDDDMTLLALRRL